VTLAPTWQRNVSGPAMHALVIGVAGYPSAKKGQGFDATLRGVEDVACTVAAARCMADWLFDNKDSLTPPLASIDLLLSDAPADPSRAAYPIRLQPQAPIAGATANSVEKHGRAWHGRFSTGDSALFFISGHGAMSGNDAVVFLSDLNSDPFDPWGAHLNISETARALKGDQRLTAAFFFSDACQEYSQRFAQVRHGDGIRIVPPQDPFLLGNARDKVSFITAASQGLETLEADWSVNPRVKMGRFTQVLLQALDGASARQLNGRWAVYAESIVADLKNLYRLRNWTDVFEPSPVLGQNERFSIVQHTQPKVPIVVKTKPPERFPDCSLEIFLPPDRSQPAIQHCGPGYGGPNHHWEVWLAASIWPHLVVATHADTKSALAFFTPYEPIFGQTIAFS
jgi:hypothetical protein